jgi:hypothetical protein
VVHEKILSRAWAWARWARWAEAPQQSGTHWHGRGHWLRRNARRAWRIYPIAHLRRTGRYEDGGADTLLGQPVLLGVGNPLALLWSPLGARLRSSSDWARLRPYRVRSWTLAAVPVVIEAAWLS